MTREMKVGHDKVQIVTLGGTIAMQSSKHGLSPSLSGDELLGFLREIDFPFQIDWKEFSNIASANITFSDLSRLSDHITSLHADGYGGVVVIQGTDTIEETAFALELLTQPAINIVVTGAMRGATHPSADGPANIISALRFLAGTSGRGEVTVVLDDTVHSARFARKTHTTRLSAFSSGEFGLRGRIHEEKFRAYNAPPVALPKISSLSNSLRAKVLLLPICLDQDSSLFAHIVEMGFGGLVLEALGAGHVPQSLAPALEDIADQIPVILCSRAGQGAVCENTYGYPGGEIDLLARGLISGGVLPGIKARILLELLLMEDMENARRRFTELVMRLS